MRARMSLRSSSAAFESLDEAVTTGCEPPFCRRVAAAFAPSCSASPASCPPRPDSARCQICPQSNCAQCCASTSQNRNRTAGVHAVHPAKYLLLLLGIELARSPVALARLECAQTRAFALSATKPFMNGGAMHAIAGNDLARTLSFAHALHGHQPYYFLRFSIMFATVFFHESCDFNHRIKVP
jgi:hypothetical protein